MAISRGSKVSGAVWLAAVGSRICKRPSTIKVAVVSTIASNTNMMSMKGMTLI